MVPQQHLVWPLCVRVCACWGFAGMSSWSEDENGGGKVLFDEFCKWAASKKLRLGLGSFPLGAMKTDELRPID